MAMRERSDPGERDPEDDAGRAERRRRRRATMVGHKTSSFDEADRWDLEFWQSKTPQERLSALVAIRRDVEMVERARESAAAASPGEADSSSRSAA